MFIKRFPSLVDHIIEFCPKIEPKFLSFIKFALFCYGFYSLNKIVGLLDYLEHWGRVRIADCISMDFKQKKRNVIIGMFVQPLNGTRMFFTR